VNRDFHKVVASAGLPDRRPHDLRHSCATLVLSRGVPLIVISEMLGHASIEITARYYAHVTRGLKQEASAKLDDLLR
jgi:integrase